MINEIPVFFAIFSIARGGLVTTSVVAAPLQASAPLAFTAKLRDSEYDPHPQYTFAYDVQDVLTGDSKGQIESRNGDFVQGQYKVVDPDGTLRTVDYTSDSVNGFNAIVKKSPLVIAPPTRLTTAHILGSAKIVDTGSAPIVPAQLPIIKASLRAPLPANTPFIPIAYTAGILKQQL